MQKGDAKSVLFLSFLVFSQCHVVRCHVMPCQKARKGTAMQVWRWQASQLLSVTMGKYHLPFLFRFQGWQACPCPLFSPYHGSMGQERKSFFLHKVVCYNNSRQAWRLHACLPSMEMEGEGGEAKFYITGVRGGRYVCLLFEVNDAMLPFCLLLFLRGLQWQAWHAWMASLPWDSQASCHAAQSSRMEARKGGAHIYPPCACLSHCCLQGCFHATVSVYMLCVLSFLPSPMHYIFSIQGRQGSPSSFPAEKAGHTWLSSREGFFKDVREREGNGNVALS